MTRNDQTTPDEEPVAIRNCRVCGIGIDIEVCMVDTPCVYAEEYPPALRLCRHPLRK